MTISKIGWSILVDSDAARARGGLRTAPAGWLWSIERPTCQECLFFLACRSVRQGYFVALPSMQRLFFPYHPFQSGGNHEMGWYLVGWAVPGSLPCGLPWRAGGATLTPKLEIASVLLP